MEDLLYERGVGEDVSWGCRLSKRVTRRLPELPKITPSGMRWDYGKTWHEILTYYEARRCS